MSKTLHVFISCALLGLCMGGSAEAAPALPAPTGLYVTACGAGKLALYWNKVKGARGYFIYRSTKPGQYNYRIPIVRLYQAPDSFVGSPMKLWVNRGLVNGREYFYTIKAVGPSTGSAHRPNRIVMWLTRKACLGTHATRKELCSTSSEKLTLLFPVKTWFHQAPPLGVWDRMVVFTNGFLTVSIVHASLIQFPKT